MPVLPQEDPKELEDRTQQAITAMKPRNPLELDLVCRAVRLAGELDRAERVGTAHLAHRVRMVTRSGTDTVSAEEFSKVHDLGSTLFFQAAIGPGYSDSSADDYPAVIVRRLEESAKVAAGCSLNGHAVGAGHGQRGRAQQGSRPRQQAVFSGRDRAGLLKCERG